MYRRWNRRRRHGRRDRRKSRGAAIQDSDVVCNDDGTYSVKSQSTDDVYCVTEFSCSCPDPVDPCKHMWKIRLFIGDTEESDDDEDDYFDYWDWEASEDSESDGYFWGRGDRRKRRGEAIEDSDVVCNNDGTYSVTSQSTDDVYCVTESTCSCPDPVNPCKHIWKIRQLKTRMHYREIRGAAIQDSDVVYNNDGTYSVKSQRTSDVYRVTETTCSCPDSFNPCKHIWKVRLLKRYPRGKPLNCRAVSLPAEEEEDDDDDAFVSTDSGDEEECGDDDDSDYSEASEDGGTENANQNRGNEVEENNGCNTCGKDAGHNKCSKCKKSVHAIPPCSDPAAGSEDSGQLRICSKCKTIAEKPSNSQAKKRSIDYDKSPPEQGAPPKISRSGRQIIKKKMYSPS